MRSPDRKTLENIWQQRLTDAKLHVDFASHYVNEVHHDCSSGTVREHAALNKAVRSRERAIEEYNRVLQIYDDLMVKGTLPDEADWLKRQAAHATGASEMAPDAT